jgi:hypothetical protein
MTELTCDSTCTEPFPFEQQHDRLVRRQDSRSPCYAAGSRSHRQCSEHAIVKTGPHQVFWNHSHCTPDNTANIKQDMTYCLSRVNAVLGGGTFRVLNKHYCISMCASPCQYCAFSVTNTHHYCKSSSL